MKLRVVTYLVYLTSSHNRCGGTVLSIERKIGDYVKNVGNADALYEHVNTQEGGEEQGEGVKELERELQDAEEEDLRESGEHTVLPVESDGEEDDGDIRYKYSNTCDRIFNIETREAEIALNSLLAHLKVMTSLAHKATLTPKQIVEFEKDARVLRDKMVQSEKQVIDSELDFSQEGKKQRKRTQRTEVGICADQTLKRRRALSEATSEEFPKQRGRGRPKEHNDALPRMENGVINWQELSQRLSDI